MYSSAKNSLQQLQFEAANLLLLYENLPHNREADLLSKRLKERCRSTVKMCEKDLAWQVKQFQQELELMQKNVKNLIQNKFTFYKKMFASLAEMAESRNKAAQPSAMRVKKIVNTLENNDAETIYFHCQNQIVAALYKKTSLNRAVEKEYHDNLTAFATNPIAATLELFEHAATQLHLEYQRTIQKREDWKKALTAQIEEADNLIYQVLMQINREANQYHWFEKHAEDKKNRLSLLKDRLIKAYASQDKGLIFADVIAEWLTFDCQGSVSTRLKPFAQKLLQDYGDESIYRDNWEEAVTAKCFANDVIKKGSTQIENNKLDRDHRLALSAAIRAIRNLYQHSDYTLCNSEVAEYEAAIKTIQKFSIGNCHELALAALDYILLHTDLRAELYRIKGGDHVFVVIGRIEGSNFHDPSTWGPHALICDPWSNVTYPAKDYKNCLKNYYNEIVQGRRMNFLERFNPDKHHLVPIPFQNTNYLRAQRNVFDLNQRFLVKLYKIQSIMEERRRELNKLVVKIESKHGPNEKKALILKTQITDLDVMIQQLITDGKRHQSLDGPEMRDSQQDLFRYKLEQYQQLLKDRVKQANNSLNFDCKDLKTLYQIRNKKSFSNRFRLFFNMGSKMENRLRKDILNIHTSLNKIIR